MRSLPCVHALKRMMYACKQEKNSAFAVSLHSCLLAHGLHAHPSLGNDLASLLVAVESIDHASRVFLKLLHPTASTWNSLIIGFINCGELQHALILYWEMQKIHFSASGCALLALLKACAQLKDVRTGSEVHAEISRRGLKEHLFISSSLVDMYAKCDSLRKAQEVFDNLLTRDTIAWNSLISGYTRLGHGEEALTCLRQMQLDGTMPSIGTFVSGLKACGSIEALDAGQELHVEVARVGLESDLHIGSTLVDMYANCGVLVKAQEVHDNLPDRTVVSWNALLGGYVKHELHHEALNRYEQMQLEGICPNGITFVCTMKACGSIGDINMGRELHFEVVRMRLENDLFVGSSLVDMYAMCGELAKAKEVFTKIAAPNVVSWNSLIAGLAKHGYSRLALHFFEKMQSEGFSPSNVSYACCLKACCDMKDTDRGRALHIEVVKKGMESEVVVGSSLIDTYASKGLLADAQKVFNNVDNQNVVSWTTLIGGYANHGSGEEALDLLDQMQLKGVMPNSATYACSLKACSSLGAIDKGFEIHFEIARRGLESDLVLGNALVDLYAKCGLLERAHEVFWELSGRDVVSWNALIGGLTRHGHAEEAFRLFELMQHDGIAPDAVSLACILNACGSLGTKDKGREIHDEIDRLGLLDTDLIIGNALVDMYVNCGLLANAQEVFGKLPARDVVSWTALIGGYVNHELYEEALHNYEQMILDNVFPNAFTLVCILKACGSVGIAEKGQSLHAEIMRKGLLDSELVGNSLVDMYAKCGLLSRAHEVFEALSSPDGVSWNALLAGHAHIGSSDFIFFILDQLAEDGMESSTATFLSIMNACSHAGIVKEGVACLGAMTRFYEIVPNLEHYTCMADVFARAGQVDKAVAVINHMPFHPNHVLWHTILNACRLWGNIALGRRAFGHAVQNDAKDAAAYLCIWKIYLDANMQEEMKEIEALRAQCG